MEVTARMTESAMVARSAAAGSMVLLKNIQGTLPLLAEDGAPLPVAVFGMGQLRTALSAGVRPWRSVCVLDALERAEEVAPDALLGRKYRRLALRDEAPEAELPPGELELDRLAGCCRAAILVLTRGCEAGDCRLRPREQALIDAVTGAFSRTVLVLNTPGYLDVTGAAKRFGAVVYMGVAGQEGGAALADLLTGRAVFSGKLADTWPRSPDQLDRAAQETDLFAGYRYYDSFGEEVLYPFGYGLSYGNPVITAFSVGLDGAEVSVEATVENAGERWPAREVVQVYVSPPGGEHPRPVYTLSGFAKTGLLQSGARETVRHRFPVTELCRFDGERAAWVLDAGYYDIRVGAHCRGAAIAGSIFVPRTMTLAELRHCVGPADRPIRSLRGVRAFSYPGEEEERAAARRRAIRLSARQLPVREVRASKKVSACRGGAEGLRLSDVRAGACSLSQLAAGMEEADLRELVYTFGRHPAKVPGAWGASADLWEKYGVPPVTVAAGCGGVRVERDVKNEDGETVRHQYATAFPLPGLLACSFDRELICAAGSAVGRELRELGVDVWLGPSAAIRRDVRSGGSHARFSEDPVVAGLCAAWLMQGCGRHAAAALCCAGCAGEVRVAERTLRELDLPGFEIAVSQGRPGAVLIPSAAVNGEALGLDSRLLSDVLYGEWGFGGMAFADGEPFARPPARPLLEQAAMRVLRLILDTAAFQKAVQ